jgi:RNA polymerase sigma-70 factor (ECF subfamily)
MCEVAGVPEEAERMSQMIVEARAGSTEALGRLLEGCRAYLLVVANKGLDAKLRAKAGASDLVQDTFVEAQKDLGQFRGRTQRELRQWLLGVLGNNLRDFGRRYGAGARRVAKERPLGGGEAAGLHNELLADTPPPADEAAAAEQLEALRRAVARLSGDHRRVIALRYEERLSFNDIGERMDRTPDAVRKLLVRVVARLRQEMGTTHDPG